MRSSKDTLQQQSACVLSHLSVIKLSLVIDAVSEWMVPLFGWLFLPPSPSRFNTVEQTHQSMWRKCYYYWWFSTQQNIVDQRKGSFFPFTIAPLLSFSFLSFLPPMNSGENYFLFKKEKENRATAALAVSQMRSQPSEHAKESEIRTLG